MEIAYADRPDLLRRLVRGQPGSIIRGPQVAVGFNEDRHVSREPIRIFKGEPLLLGVDGGLTPTLLIGQAIHGWLRIIAALTIDRGGMRQLLETYVVPWMVDRAPWVLRANNLIKGVYDPAMPDDESDSDRNPVKVLQEILGGQWQPGPTSWEARKGAMITALNARVEDKFYALQIDPTCKGLIQALSTRWHYAQNRLGAISNDLPAKPNHPWEDYGDSFCYWVCCAVPELIKRTMVLNGQNVVNADYNPLEQPL
jgi:hypothetical protein